ncbi:hypothetical protein EW146_g8252 [Bondarzewia mesenterica]|uniref:Glycosyltransferase family 24 protein n=1 Tax=Bondarzewia mesenterica TaxID=1095465 RepID=A0A4S4LG38_9AGAM|nr:hypothetical protein EW146_g8252 [Bondarzewia mesenterica]
MDREPRRWVNNAGCMNLKRFVDPSSCVPVEAELPVQTHRHEVGELRAWVERRRIFRYWKLRLWTPEKFEFEATFATFTAATRDMLSQPSGCNLMQRGALGSDIIPWTLEARKAVNSKPAIMRARHALSSLCVAAALIFCSDAASPLVKVSLRTSWPSPPFLLEVVETISLEDPDAFFPILDVITDPETSPSREPLLPEALQQLALQTAISLDFFIKTWRYNPAHIAESRDREACGSWVEWYGEVVCDIERLVHLAGSETIDNANASSPFSHSFSRPRTLPFDHIYPIPSRTLNRPPRTAILYASIESSNFLELHSYLMRMSSSPAPKIEYIFRPIPPTSRGNARTSLSGYGVTLDLKKMDYLALDDRHTSAGGSSAEDDELSENLESAAEPDPVISLLNQHPLKTAHEASEPLTEDELAQIGVQAIQIVYESSDPFATLKQLVQDFPRYASSLARRVVVNPELANEVHRNSFKAQAGASVVWLNGATVPDASMNPFSLLKKIRKERDIMLSLTSLGIEPHQALALITHPSIQAAHGTSGSALDGIFDASDRPEDGGLIIWWNDVEKDSRYARWPAGLHALMRPTYPGQIPVIRANLFNVVLVMDLSQTSSLYYLASTISNIINRGFPVRFGFVPAVESDEDVRMAKIIDYLVNNYGRARTMNFIKKVLQLPMAVQQMPEHVNWELVRSEFQDLIKVEDPKEGGVTMDFDTVTGNTIEELQSKVSSARAYAKRLGATMSSSPQGHVFFNGKHYDLDDVSTISSSFICGFTNMITDFHSNLANGNTEVSPISTRTPAVALKLYQGTLTEENAGDVSTYFYDLPTSQKSRNRHIFPSSNADGLVAYNMPEVIEKTDFVVRPAGFVYPPNINLVPFTIYVVADLDTEGGLSIMESALTYVGASRARLSFIHNPTSPLDGVEERNRVSWLISHLISQDALSGVHPARLLRALGYDTSIVTNDHEQIVLSPDAIFEELTGGVSLDDLDGVVYDDFVRSCRTMARALRLRPGDIALVVNGRLVGPVEPGDFTAEDFKTLENYEYLRRVEPVIRALGEVLPETAEYDQLPRATFADMVSMTSSIVSHIHIVDPSEGGLVNQPQMTRSQNYKLMESEYSGFEMGDNSTALYRFVVVLDPLSEQAQRYTSLFEWLSNFPLTHFAFYINAAPYRELPLKRFYRYNLMPRLVFDESGHEIPSTASFTDLPVEPIYTLDLDEPSSWLVRPKEALFDLDNIQLNVLSSDERQQGVEVMYELDYLIIGGHARDTLTSGPPRGVQLQLTSSAEPIDDTLVVANLGYLQFKAKPGVYRLEIREGRGREIFTMESVGNEGWESPTVEEVGNEITLTSFEGLTLYPRLARLPGMEQEDVLHIVEEPEPTNIISDIFSRVSSLFHPKVTVEVKSASPHADINIFTVASGLLYERFASIMILSVLRNTNHSVKFWFIENFLSPSFLEFIPHFAGEYGFKYELVTYKWPTWLRQQREKQRIIWAYKILFLDVLFPMDLDKVIFVDADQIVRADLKELIDLDLHGAPYGYTPMGDDNYEMEGFRFWKTGYWESFLRGRPYHISALYVVDLVRFRLMAAGDILRSHYQQLSADPNSLANLDQDLPNNLQLQVPIYSLHEDWLWCETWCSKDRLHRAKTIDLCQNPLTKEPKLSRARQIPEWEEYDAEIARFTRQLAVNGRIHSTAATADVNELANAGSSPVRVENSENEIGSEGVQAPTRDEL